MTQGHASRAHAPWSASSAARNWACSGALAMAIRLDRPDKESVHSARGTACHEIAERCLTAGGDADQWLGTTIKTRSHEVEIDDELCASAQVFLDYTRDRIPADGWIKVEQHFSLAALEPPIEAGGTADAVIYDADEGMLEVVDLKNGMGKVEVEGNKQLRSYALGALLANPGLAVKRVRMTIVQPRAIHRDGPIRSETIHVADLLDWTNELLGQMRQAAQALAEIDTMPYAAWWSRWLVAGDHCRYCAAEGNCPAQDQAAMDAVGLWFDDLDHPRFANRPDELDPAALSARLDLLDQVEAWIAGVRRYAHDQAEGGVEIPAYQLVETIGHRKWAVDETAVREELTKAGLTDDKIYAPRKLRSPAQAEKVLGAKRKALIAGITKRDITGRNLVRNDKTSRPAVTPAVLEHFSKIEE